MTSSVCDAQFCDSFHDNIIAQNIAWVTIWITVIGELVITYLYRQRFYEVAMIHERQEGWISRRGDKGGASFRKLTF
jgi:hypothetical protein